MSSLRALLLFCAACSAALRPSSPSSLAASRRDLTYGAVHFASAASLLLLQPQSSSARVGSLPELADNAGVLRGVTLNTKDLASALTFYTSLGLSVLQPPSVSGDSKTAVLSFGPTELSIPRDFVPGISAFSEYGGHVALILKEAVVPSGGAAPFYEPGNVVDFIQFGVPSLRLSKLLEAGGTILSTYGWSEVLSPDGVKHKVVVGRRRDPLMMVALKSKRMKDQAALLESIGMAPQPFPIARPVPDSPFEPTPPKKSKYYGFDKETPGILLVPATGSAPMDPGNVVAALDFAMDAAAGESKTVAIEGLELRLSA